MRLKLIGLGAVALTVAGCVPPGTNELSGIDHGPRHVWVKDGATDRETRVQMLICADENPGMVEAIRAGSIPFVGFGAAVVSQGILERRTACMEGAGYRLTEARTGRTVRINDWGAIVPVEPASQP